jgi:hypothetical protein
MWLERTVWIYELRRSFIAGAEGDHDATSRRSIEPSHQLGLTSQPRRLLSVGAAMVEAEADRSHRRA